MNGRTNVADFNLPAKIIKADNLGERPYGKLKVSRIQALLVDCLRVLDTSHH